MFLLRIAAVAAVMMAILVGGCGGDGSADTVTETGVQEAGTATDTTSPAADPDCDMGAASIIPEPSGRPQHVYFYRDT